MQKFILYFVFCFLGFFYLGGRVGGYENSEQSVGQAEDPPLAGSACSVRAEGFETEYSIIVKVGLGKGSLHSHNTRAGCGALLYTFHLSRALSIQENDGGWYKAQGDPYEPAQRQCHLKSSRFPLLYLSRGAHGTSPRIWKCCQISGFWKTVQ